MDRYIAPALRARTPGRISGQSSRRTTDVPPAVARIAAAATRPGSTRLVVLAALVALLPVAPRAAADPPAATVAVETLIAEALTHNPEILAARHEQEAATHHAGAAGALEDPTLEFGVVIAPQNSVSITKHVNAWSSFASASLTSRFVPMCVEFQS